ncbi:MAG: hypothetical protein HQ475_09335 [SAR202 cluster bacterium]|nr:hypothetical protein [SAR202 cluster bacterium]
MTWTSRPTYVTGYDISSSDMNQLVAELNDFDQKILAKDKLIENAIDVGLVVILNDDGTGYLDNPHRYENDRLQRENILLQESNRLLRAENYWLRSEGSEEYVWQSDSAAWGFSEN